MQDSLDSRVAAIICFPYGCGVAANGCPEYTWRVAARKVLPDEIIDRQKVGFFVPMNEWFKGDLKEYTQELLSSPNSFARSFMSLKNWTRF